MGFLSKQYFLHIYQCLCLKSALRKHFIWHGQRLQIYKNEPLNCCRTKLNWRLAHLHLGPWTGWGDTRDRARAVFRTRSTSDRRTTQTCSWWWPRATGSFRRAKSCRGNFEGRGRKVSRAEICSDVFQSRIEKTLRGSAACGLQPKRS